MDFFNYGSKACAAICNACSWKRQLASSQQTYTGDRGKLKFKRSRRLTVGKDYKCGHRINVGLYRRGNCCAEEGKLQEDVKSGIILCYTITKSNRCSSSHIQSTNLSMLVIDTILGSRCTQQMATIFRISDSAYGWNECK